MGIITRRLSTTIVCISLILLIFASGCIIGQERQRPPSNLSLNRTDPGTWKGRLPGPSELTLGRTNSIKGTQEIDPETYRLTINGAVENPMTLSFRDILEYSYLERENVMYCVEGWSFEADWRGIGVRDILAEVDPKAEAKRVIFHAVDGYSSSFPIVELNSTDSFFLAYMANGQYLARKHGFPLRLIAEGKWGYKWVKWVVGMEVTENPDHLGYWEKRGYPDDADVS